VKYLARAVPLDLDVLKERYHQELRWQMGNPERGITAQKKAQASLRQNENAEPSVRMPTGEGARMAELSERIEIFYGV